MAVLTRNVEANVSYELAGDAAFTLSEFAAEIAKQSGKAIRYLNMEIPHYVAALTQAGLPQNMAEILGDSDAGAAKGALYNASRDLHKLIGRATTSLSAAVSEGLFVT